MTATLTWDVFSTLDGYGSYVEGADWGGYWGRQVPELLEHRAALFREEQRLVFGATTFRENAELLGALPPEALDEWNRRLLRMPATVISSTLEDGLGWADATILRGDGVELVRRLKEESPVPLLSLASMTLNWALLEAGLIDRMRITVFPVVSGRTGTSPILRGAGDLDLELLDSRTFDGRSVELTYRPSPRRSS